jgi:hypothetical protein
MNTKLFLLAFICGITILGTASAEAYVSSSKSAEKLNDTYRLYSVGFNWSFSDKDLLVPVLAKRDLPTDTSETALGYRIESAGGLRVSHGTTTALVIADLPIENGYYKLKAGEVGKFRLLALHQTASTTQPLRLKVSALPFKFETTDKETKTYLQQNELRGYVTTAI